VVSWVVLPGSLGRHFHHGVGLDVARLYKKSEIFNSSWGTGKSTLSGTAGMVNVYVQEDDPFQGHCLQEKCEMSHF
jgi:hypothetical protein